MTTLDQLLHPGVLRLRGGKEAQTAYLALLMSLVFLRHRDQQAWRTFRRIADSDVPGAKPGKLIAEIGKRADVELRKCRVTPGALSVIRRMEEPTSDDLKGWIHACESFGRSEFDQLLGTFGEVSRLGADGYFTSPELGRLLAALVNCESADSLRACDPYMRDDGFLRALCSIRPPGATEVVGYGPHPSTRPFAGMSLVLNGQMARVLVGNNAPWTNPGIRLHEWDAVFLNPPFGSLETAGIPADICPFGIPSADNAILGFAQYAIGLLAPGGRAGILMPQHVLIGGSGQRGILERMIAAGVLEAVVALPKKLFTESAANVNLWVVKTPAELPSPVLFINAAEMIDRSRRPQVFSDDAVDLIAAAYKNRRDLTVGKRHDLGTNGQAIMLDSDAIAGAGYSLAPLTYLGSDVRSTSAPKQGPLASAGPTDLRELAQRAWELYSVTAMLAEATPSGRAGETRDQFSQWTREPLKGICDIQAGPSYSRVRVDVRSKTGTVPILMPKHLRDRRIVARDAETMPDDVAERFDSKFRLAAGDIVCVRTGAIVEPVIVPPDCEGWLFGTNLLRLRLWPLGNGHAETVAVDVGYLHGFLCLPSTLAWIRGLAGKTAASSISKDALARLQVPVPAIEEQRRIGTFLQSLDDLIGSQREQLSATIALRDEVAQRLIGGGLEIR
jgi:type I restriction enzyme M protein